MYHTDNVKVNVASYNLAKLGRNQEGVDVIATLLLMRLKDNKSATNKRYGYKRDGVKNT